MPPLVRASRSVMTVKEDLRFERAHPAHRNELSRLLTTVITQPTRHADPLR